MIAIADQNAETVARYTYDAWGVCTVTADTSGADIAAVNPFRYRSYYYDTETGLYYLQSRYYDPTVGRFINADDCESLRQTSNAKVANLFAYCENDPVNGTDATGSMLVQKLAEIFLSAVFGMVLQFFTDVGVYLVRKLIYGKDEEFTQKPGDYVASALEWALDCLNIFSKKRKFLATFLLNSICSIVGRVTNWICGVKFELGDLVSFASDIFFAAVKAALKAFVISKISREISKLKKYRFKSRNVLHKQKLQIKAQYKILGQRITTIIAIPEMILNIALSIFL